MENLRLSVKSTVKLLKNSKIRLMNEAYRERYGTLKKCESEKVELC